MTTNLTEAELTTLESMNGQAQNSQIGYWEIYKWLADRLVLKGAALTDSTLLWLRGATEANKGEGAFAALIRTYTETQYKLRYGVPLPSGSNQEADLMYRASTASCSRDPERATALPASFWRNEATRRPP